MDSKELRIGNLVLDDSIETVVNGRLLYHMWDFGHEVSKDIKPIPLTEEWLLKFGFEKIKNNGIDYELHDCVISVNAKWMWTTESNLNEVRTLIPTHVHTLQNLYFALTGEELTIKE